MDIGILGGTFDPVHFGHLRIAEEAGRGLGLTQVLFVPAGKPWLKTNRAITPAAHRVEMVSRAISDNSVFKLSTAEVGRPGVSYTVDTIAILQRQLGAEANLFLLLGWDSLAELPRWKEPGTLVKMCRLVAFPRAGFSLPELEALETFVPGLRGSLVLPDMLPVDISSSDIRERVARGLSIRGLVPHEVERYIEEQKLYQQGE